MFRSPTCTERDKEAAQELAKIAKIEIESFANKMFRAGSNLSSKTPEEIFYQDYKKFIAEGDISFGVGQISSMDHDELAGIIDRMTEFMEKVRPETGLNMLFFMLTDILEESTMLLCVGPDALPKVAEYSGCPVQGNVVMMEGVVSRKKQVVPTLMQAFQS